MAIFCPFLRSILVCYDFGNFRFLARFDSFLKLIVKYPNRKKKVKTLRWAHRAWQLAKWQNLIKDSAKCVESVVSFNTK